MENTRYAVGVDLGTNEVKVVVAAKPAASLNQNQLNETSRNLPNPTIVGVGLAKNSGMRKGTIVNLDKTAEALDKALETAEQMSGFAIDFATVNINGSHILGLASQGVIAVSGGQIGQEEIDRVTNAATVVQLPANREILDITPHSYKLDSQDNIRDPFGMTGVRLEVNAFILTALAPHLRNLERVLEMTSLKPHHVAVGSLAAAGIALSDEQRENGVTLIDIGAATTNIAVFEEGDLIHCAALPVGSHNITNDLAIGLKVDLAVAEAVKLQHAVAAPELRRGNHDQVTVKLDAPAGKFDAVSPDKPSREMTFDVNLIDEIVEARLAEIFELINRELKKVKKNANLPGGAVLTGGGANLRGLADYAREVLSMSTHVAKMPNFAGMSDKTSNPRFATALGLTLIDLNNLPAENVSPKGKSWLANAKHNFGKLFSRK